MIAADLRQLVADLEWSGMREVQAPRCMALVAACPSCRGLRPTPWQGEEIAGQSYGHADACRLRAALVDDGELDESGDSACFGDLVAAAWEEHPPPQPLILARAPWWRRLARRSKR